MLKKIYKTVETEEGQKITIYGSNRPIRTDIDKDGRTFFKYRGITYTLDEFMAVPYNGPLWMKEFHGYLNDSFFSGVFIKLDEESLERVKAYTFIS